MVVHKSLRTHLFLVYLARVACVLWIWPLGILSTPSIPFHPSTHPHTNESSKTGAEALASTLMLPFFATIGAAGGGMGAAPELPAVLLLIAVQLGVHSAVLVGVGRLALRIPTHALLVASNAGVGGPGTAAAMAGARRWPTMVQPAMLTGALGYAVGTGVGCWVGRCLAP